MLKDERKPANSAVGQRTVPDWPLFLLVLLILAVGLLLVFDASYARAAQSGMSGANPYYFFCLQGVWAIVGILMLTAALCLPYWKLYRLGPYVIIISVILLLLVYVPHIGSGSHGAVRWIRLGRIQIQPSEIAKLCVVFYLAWFLSRKQGQIKDINTIMVGALAPIGIVALLIIKEPDLGTALTLLSTAFVMLALGGARKKHLFTIAMVGISLFLLYAMSHPYSIKRLQGYIDPSAGGQTYAYQVNESVQALEAGGVHGLGPGHGDAKFFHLPAPYTDFIAATVGEEFGLIGTLCLLSLFFSFSLRGLHIAHRCPNVYGTLLAAGLTSSITIQAILNLAVISRSLPDTGVPLPMISYGGSSLVLAMFATGLILSVSRWPNANHVDTLLRRSSLKDPGLEQTRRRSPLHVDMEFRQATRQ